MNLKEQMKREKQRLTETLESSVKEVLGERFGIGVEIDDIDVEEANIKIVLSLMENKKNSQTQTLITFKRVIEETKEQKFPNYYIETIAKEIINEEDGSFGAVSRPVNTSIQLLNVVIQIIQKFVESQAIGKDDVEGQDEAEMENPDS